MSADLKQEEKKRDSKADLSKQFKERLIVDEKIPCTKCTLKQKKLVLYSCSHKLCFNCIFKFFISNGFKGLNTSSVKSVCPQCKKGNIEISLDDYIDILNQLLKTKDPNFDKSKEEEKEKEKEKEEEQKKEEEKKQEEEKKKSEKKTDDANTDGNCKIHKDQKLIKHCNDCNVDLCEQCLESHNQGFPDHVLTDMIFEEKKEEKKEEEKQEEKKDNEKKEENKKTESNANNKDSISDEIYNKEMNDIKQKEKKILEKT